MNNELKEQNSNSTAIKFGMMGGLASILVSLLLYFINLHFNDWAKWLPTLVLIGFIVAGIKAIADEMKPDAVAFGKLFSGGMLIMLIIAVFSIAYLLLYSIVIEPSYVDRILDITRTKLVEKGLGESQMEQALKMTEKFLSPMFMVIFATIGSLLFGTIASIIGAAIFKREK